MYTADSTLLIWLVCYSLWNVTVAFWLFPVVSGNVQLSLHFLEAEVYLLK